MQKLMTTLASAILAIAGICVDRLGAQEVANAQVHGRVTDSTGAVVSGATVKATQTDTGQVRTTVSTSEGDYVLANLPVGPYRIEVTAPGFSTYVQSGVVLQVGNNVQINTVLQVGSLNQEVHVSANAAMVEILKVPEPSPPVPQVSRIAPSKCTGVAFARIT